MADWNLQTIDTAFILDFRTTTIFYSGMLVIKTLKSKISDFLNSNTCFCLQLYGTYSSQCKVNFQKCSTLLQDQEFYNFMIGLLIEENTILNGFY